MNFLRRKDRGHRNDMGYNNNTGYNTNTTGFNNNNNTGFNNHTGPTGTMVGTGHHHHNDNVAGYNNNNNYNTGPTGTAVGRDNSTPMTSNRNRNRDHNRSSIFNRHDKHDRHDGGRHESREEKREERRLRKQEKKQNRRGLFDINSGNFNRRPSFGQWIKFMWLDILTMAALGAVGLGVYNADPAPSRSFPITFSDNEVVYPEFAYPLRSEIVPIWEAALLASLIPIAVILLMQIRIRSFWDTNNAIVGLLYSLITAAVFQVFVKWLIGGLRPHFLYVCAPDMSRVLANGNVRGQGFRNIMFQRDICTGDRNQINDSLESMPSGHSTAAFAGFIYLYFYLNAKLKVFSNYHPAMWKLVATYAPVLGACLIAGSLTIDKYHNWYDCFAGAVIGTVMAISAYRMVYASVWDFRFNHIPLTRHTPFSYGAGEAGAGGFETAVFTRKAGWGYEEAYGGAPFDAAHHLRGAQAGFNNAVHNNEHGQKGMMGHNKHGHGLGHNDRALGGNNDTALGTNDRGLGHNNSTGLGHHHDNRDLRNDPAYGATGNQTAGVGVGHDRGRLNDRDSMAYNNVTGTGMDNQGLGRHHREGDIEHNAASDMAGTGIGPGGGGRMDDPQGPNRYKIHSRSLERKALNRNSQGNVV